MTNAQRQVVANIALRDLHPGWMPCLEPLQLASATGSPWGRRWLARQLSADCLLFDERWSGGGEFLRLEGWVYLPSVLWSSWLKGLGALSLGLPPAIACSAQRRRALLDTADAQVRRYCSGTPVVLTDWPPTELAIARTLMSEGVRQLHHYAMGHHPFAAERVRLAFPPALTRTPPVRALPSATVSAFVAAVMSGSAIQEESSACPRTEMTLIPSD
jgi:hypothetical protein